MSQSQDQPAPLTPTTQPIPCAACRYNIAGLPEHGVCPECASPVRLSLPPRAGSLPFLKCSQCLYQLASLPPDRNCPECGVAISTSIAWVQTLRLLKQPSSTRWLGGLLIFLGLVLYVVAIFSRSYHGISPQMLAGAAAWTCGLFLLSRLPDREFPSTITWHYTAIRTLAITIAATALIWTFARVLMRQAPRASEGLAGLTLAVTSPIFFISHVLALGSSVCLRFHIHRALRRHPE
jgi:hypothetical protein